MRIAVHDFAGHPFQVQLSRELARNGHSVSHLYLRDLPGPKGTLEALPNDPASFSSVPVSLGAPLAKYSMIKRHFAHRQYARALAASIADRRPDVVLSANTPIDVQHYLLRECQKRGVAFVHWMQDLYCMAVRSVLKQKLGPCGAPLAWHYDRLERQVCETSNGVVFITSDFLTAVSRMGIKPAQSYVIENWAPLDDLVPAPKNNLWSARHQLTGKLVFLYSGTLGLKHKPELLFRLAEALEDRDDAVVVVITEGLGRNWLEQQMRRSPKKNLLLMDFQAYAEMPEVLSAADVLVAILEQEAGVFAVPSKVLSYLCAGRPVLLAAPEANLAARTVARARAGITVNPNDIPGLVGAARFLAGNPDRRACMGANAIQYAKTAFDIRAIANRFEFILREAVETAGRRAPASERYSPAYPEIAANS
jgi:colanic acid biosynthesis glycosyl transferase WcaI